MSEFKDNCYCADCERIRAERCEERRALAEQTEMLRKEREQYLAKVECEVNREKHLNHEFYQTAHNQREDARRGQILKGADKYPKPFTPSDWTPRELLNHALQENVDQAHYISGMFEKIEEYEKKIAVLEGTQAKIIAERDEYREKWEISQNNIEKLLKDLQFAKAESEHWRNRLILEVEKNKPTTFAAQQDAWQKWVKDVNTSFAKAWGVFAPKGEKKEEKKGENIDEKA